MKFHGINTLKYCKVQLSDFNLEDRKVSIRKILRQPSKKNLLSVWKKREWEWKLRSWIYNKTNLTNFKWNWSMNLQRRKHQEAVRKRNKPWIAAWNCSPVLLNFQRKKQNRNSKWREKSAFVKLIHKCWLNQGEENWRFWIFFVDKNEIRIWDW